MILIPTATTRITGELYTRANIHPRAITTSKKTPRSNAVRFLLLSMLWYRVMNVIFDQITILAEQIRNLFYPWNLGFHTFGRVDDAPNHKYQRG